MTGTQGARGEQIEIAVGVDRTREERIREVVRIVQDTGIGIAAGEIEHIFEKFYRTTNGARYAHGTGLGLSIAHSIVLLHGGRLAAESDGATGTTMTVELSDERPPDTEIDA